MDRTSKILLAVIAVGLWANIAVTVFRPLPASAQGADLATEMAAITDGVVEIANGFCKNQKICGR